MTTPTQVPDKLRVGDSWAWTRDLADYPAGTWTAVYYFKNPTANFSVSASASGTTHSASVAPATTATRSPGRYFWQLVVTSGGTRTTVDGEEGWTELLPDPASAVNRDYRSFARIALENVEAYLRDPNNIAAASYSIGGRSLSRFSRSELLSERDKLAAEVRSEDAAARVTAGLGNPRRFYVRFDRG